MNEERWHNFAKEKPSEDMEGRNFIVSNGHYEKIATWCGYWENEPFMGDHLCDEVVRWKFYFTLEEEKANEATHTELKPMKCDELKRLNGFGNFDKFGGYYDADNVDALLANKDAAIAELKARIQLDDDEMAGFLQLEEECGGGDLRNYIAELKARIADLEKLNHDLCERVTENDDIRLHWEEVEQTRAANERLKAKLEDVQASAYTESVDAGMRERRLRRALWLAREWRAWCEGQFWFVLESDRPRDIYHLFITKRIHRTPEEWIAYWQKVEQKCRTKAEEYK